MTTGWTTDDGPTMVTITHLALNVSQQQMSHTLKILKIEE